VSAYSYPAAAPPQPRGAADPTAVMARRTGAWVVDFLIYLVIMAFLGPTPLSPLAEYYDVEGVDDPCEILQEGDQYDAATCVVVDDRAYVTSSADVAVQIVVSLALFVGYCVLQGATGRTPGKALLGVKVVDERGGNPGFGRSLGRTVLWAVDGFPWCLPLVGFILGLSTPGHRRVGDMAAKTFVVGKAHTGPVVVPGLTPSAPQAPAGYPPPGGYPAPGGPGQPWGAPGGGWASGAPGSSPQPTPGGWGAPPPAGGPAGGGPAGPPPSGVPGAGPSAPDQRPAPPGATPSDATPAETTPEGAGGPGPAAPSPEPGGRPQPQATPGTTSPGAPSGAGGADPAGARPAGEESQPSTPPPGGGTATPGTPAGSATAPAEGTATGEAQPSTPPPGGQAGAPGGQATGPSAAGQAPTQYNPQWDAARGTYIVWDPNRGQWLGWDERTKEWKPL